MRWVLQNIRKRKSKKNGMRHKNNRWTMNRTKGWKQISILRHSCIPELMNPSDWYGRWIEFFFSSPPDSEQQHHWTAIIQPHNHNPATLIHYSTEWLLVSSLNLLEKKKNLYSMSSGSLAVCVCVRARMFVCMRVSVCVWMSHFHSVKTSHLQQFLQFWLQQLWYRPAEDIWDKLKRNATLTINLLQKY